MARSQCIFEYCNFGKGYLKISFPEKKSEQVKEFTIALEDYLVNDGVIVHTEPLVERIKFEMTKLGISKMPSIMLLLRCREVYKNTVSIPTKQSIYAGYLYSKEIKSRFDKDKYLTVTNSYKRGVGYTYNTYFVPNAIVDSFASIAKQLSTDLVELKIYGMYLFESLDNDGCYVYFDIKSNCCSLILVSDSNLITSFDFEFERDEEIRQKFFLVAAKHELEFEKLKITHYGVNSDRLVKIDIGIPKLGEPDAAEEQGISHDAAEAATQAVDGLEVDTENYDDDKTLFSQRYGDAGTVVRTRYDALSKTLLNYTGMKCRVTEQCAVFHIDSDIYAKMDIRDSRVMLYLPLNPKKYISSRYPCALTKRRGFDTTPCLYRIATAFRYEGAYELLDDLASERGLVPKS